MAWVRRWRTKLCCEMGGLQLQMACLLQVNIPDANCVGIAVLSSQWLMLLVLWNLCCTSACLTSSFKCKCCHWQRRSTPLQYLQRPFELLRLRRLLIRTASAQRWPTRQPLHPLVKSKGVTPVIPECFQTPSSTRSLWMIQFLQFYSLPLSR